MTCKPLGECRDGVRIGGIELLDLDAASPPRFLFAAEPAAMGDVQAIVCRALASHLIKKAGLTLTTGQTGAVTLIQRFGSALKWSSARKSWDGGDSGPRCQPLEHTVRGYRRFGETDRLGPARAGLSGGTLFVLCPYPMLTWLVKLDLSSPFVSPMRFEYVDTPEGQLHLRRHGQGAPQILLHWAPASGRMYEPAMREFASRGFECLAFDLPGYGRSHKNARGWTIPQYAANLLHALDQLGIDRFHLLGGHLSASIAVEMALTSPARIEHLVLDGLLNLSGSEWTDLLHRFQGMSPMMDRPMMDREGEFRAFPFDMVVSTLREWNPEFVLSDATLPQVYALLNDYLEMGLDPIRDFVEPESGPGIEAYDLAGALSGLRVSTLVLSADREPLQAAFRRSLDAIPGASGHVFPGVHPLVSERAGEYIEAIVAHFSTPSAKTPGRTG